MLKEGRRSRWKKVTLLISVGASSALYLALAVRFTLHFGSSSLNSSARVFFMGMLGVTVLLYAIALIQAIIYRFREDAIIPICLAALFGSFVCIVSMAGSLAL